MADGPQETPAPETATPDPLERGFAGPGFAGPVVGSDPLAPMAPTVRVAGLTADGFDKEHAVGRAWLAGDR